MDRSHLILRTNPRLTGNIKLMVGHDNVYMSTIQVNDTLSDQQYVSNPINPISNYSVDVYSIFNSVPKNILYQIPEIDHNQYARKNSEQYIQTYNYGCRRLISKLYDEQFSSFAPLLIGDKIPDAYVLFKIPLSKQHEIKSWTASDYYKNADIVTTFDLKKSKIGTYVQNLVNHPLFHNPPITVNYETKTVTYCGISVYKGSIISITESILHLFDQELPIKDFDQYITDGFYRNGLILSNLLNLEFIFNDVVTDFSTSAYYGLYVSYKDIDDYDPIKIQQDYNQYLKNCYCYVRNDDGIQKYHNSIEQPLQYDRSLVVQLVRSSGYSSMSLRLDKDLEVGYELRLYLNGKYLETIILDTLLQLDANDYQYQQWSNIGQLQTFVNPIGSKSEVLHRIGLAVQWVLQAVENYSYKFFVDQDELVFYSNNKFVPTLSICSYLLDRNGQSLSDGYITFSSFNLIGYSSSKGKRFKIAKSQLPILQSKLILLENHQYAIIETISANVDEELIDENHNLIETDSYRNYCVVTINDTLPQILFKDNTIQLYSKQQFKFGVLDVSPISDFDYDFYSMEYASGHESEYSHYYSVRSGDLVIGRQYTAFNNNKDNTFELQISAIIDSRQQTAVSVPKGGKITFIAQSTDYTVVSGAGTIVDNFYLTDNELNTFVGFNTLSTTIGKSDNKLKINSFKDNSKNEYEILKENSTSLNNYLSKLIPHVNKWVMNNKDIRNNEYRLNMSSSFGSLSFTPSFNAIESDPSKFTHEWYYLSCYPKGLTKEEVYNSSSYFDHTFDVEQYAHSNTDYFTDYFTVNSRTIIKKNGPSYTATVLPVKFQRRYSIIHKDQDTLDTYSTFFRGCKMSFSSNDVDIDGYKFSCILNLKRTNQDSFSIDNPFSIDVVRNDTFKNMVIVITALIDDYKILDEDGQVNSGYLYLYVMNHLQSISDGKLRYGIKFNLPINPQLLSYDIQYGSSNDKHSLDFSSVYGTRLGFQTGGRYSDFWNDGGMEASVLQFNINQLKVNDFYHLDSNGRYQELIGFNKKQLFFTNGSSYDLNSREILINDQSSGVHGFTDYGIKLRAIKKSQKNSINYTDGGITTIKYVDSPNKLPVDTYTTNALKKNGSLINSNWIILGGGYDHYKKLNSLLAFSNICKLFSSNSPIVQYYVVKNNRIIPSKDYFNIQFVQPSVIKLQSGLVSTDKDVILKELPNVVLQDTEINASKTPIELYRYSGEFYPKLTEVANFSGIISKANWKTKLQQWINVNKQWLDKVTTDEVITAVNTWINDSRLQSNTELQNNNVLLSGNLTLKNYYYRKINQELPIIPLSYPTNGYSSIEKENKNLLSSVLDESYYHGQSKESLDYNQFQSFFGSVMTTMPTSMTIVPTSNDCIISGNTIKFSLSDVLYTQVKEQLIAGFNGIASEEWISEYLSQYLIKSYFVNSIAVWSKSNDQTVVIPEKNELVLMKQNYDRLLMVDIKNQDYNYTLTSDKFINKRVTIHITLSLV